MYTCVYLHVGIHKSADVCGGQKKAVDPLKLESQVLGPGLGSFTDAASAQTTEPSSSPIILLLKRTLVDTLSFQNFLLSTNEWVNKK